jgi:RND family efflux transporter MFP subunit
MRAYCWLMIAVAMAGCGKNAYQPPPPPVVTVATPAREQVTQSLEYTGTTVPYERVEVRARVEGYLVPFPQGSDAPKKPTQGDLITAGTLLYCIDPKPFEARVAQAEAARVLAEARVVSGRAQLAGAQARELNARTQLARLRAAGTTGAVTQSEIDEGEAAYKTAEAEVAAGDAAINQAQAEVQAAEAALREAQLELGYTKVTSPIDGRVGRDLVDTGNLVGRSESTHLTTVVRYDPIYVEFTISEADLLQWITWRENGVVESTPTGRAKNAKLFMQLANETGFPHEGLFDYADLTLDESTGTFLVRGLFPNANREIPPGAFVRIRVPVQQIEALLIDDTAIMRDQAGAYVLIVDDENVVQRRNIEVGDLYDGRRAILSGIDESARVVVNGLLLARPGATVSPKLRDVTQATSAAPTASAGGVE